MTIHDLIAILSRVEDKSLEVATLDGEQGEMELEAVYVNKSIPVLVLSSWPVSTYGDVEVVS